MRTTPATRDFIDAPVPDELLYSLLDAARFAPSGGNRQGWHVVVLKDPAVRARIRDLYVIAWREYMAHVARGLVPFAPLDAGRWTGPAVDLDEARATPAPMEFSDHLDRVPVLLVLVVELAALAVMDNGLDRQSIVGGASVYPFAHNILLAARDAGLGGVMTTVLCREEAAVREVLGLADGYAVAALVALGHPVKHVTRLRRESVEKFTTIDRVDGQPFTG
ncbi:MAG: nitroreductase family protein [Acidimicrobiia bacterium]